MSSIRNSVFVGVLAFLLLWSLPGLARHAASTWADQPSQTASPQAEIAAFNRKFIQAHLRMDNAGVMSFWADDGVSLPGMKPMVGKKAIAKFLDDIVAQMPGYRVTRQEIDFQGIQVSGDWASEWGLEYQVVKPPDAKPPIESRGKILLVLHKATGGDWKIKQEMWNSGVKLE